MSAAPTAKLHVDFETFCPVSIKDVGAHVYVKVPGFDVTVIAWAFDDGPVQSVQWPYTQTLPEPIRAHILMGGTVCAHNAAFEHAVLTGHYGLTVKFEQTECSMQRAYVWGLPSGLGAAGKALGLAVRKDETEKPLMLSMSKPRKATKKEPNPLPLHQVDAAKLDRLAAYCRQDVEAERALGRAIPKAILSEFERKVSLLDAESNAKGVLVDRVAVLALQVASLKEETKLNAEAEKISGGRVKRPGSDVPKIMAWLASRTGMSPLPNLQKATVAEALDGVHGTLCPDQVRMLELRQLAAKSSIKKLRKMEMTAGADGRARGLLQYYGAGRTGRWAGRQIQVQNLPRGRAGISVEAVIEAAQRFGELDGSVFANPLDCVSRALRGCLVAAPGKVLVSLDLSQIEARVLAWLAGQADVVEAFRRGEDVYVLQAAKVGSGDRQLGKVLTLAAGFGMGGERFMETARTYGVELSLAEAENAVHAWRHMNDKIKFFWWNVETAVVAAMGEVPTKGRLSGPLGGRQTVRGIAVQRVGRALGIRKPNQEKLWYQQPTVTMGPRGWIFGYMSTAKHGSGWVPLTSYGGKFVENITQAVARDVMAESLLRIKHHTSMVPVMTVHDEAVYEIAEANADQGSKALKHFFTRSPEWAKDLPVGADVKIGRRYSK